MEMIPVGVFRPRHFARSCVRFQPWADIVIFFFWLLAASAFLILQHKACLTTALTQLQVQISCYKHPQVPATYRAKLLFGDSELNAG